MELKVQKKEGRMPNWISILGLAGWIALCFAAAALGARYMPGPWFEQLKKPPWNPPNWVFGPVWTLLYTLMAVAAWHVWGEGGWKAQGIALSLFLAQLLFNGLWSWLFFGLKSPGLAFADIAALWITLLVTVLAFWSVKPVAGLLLTPYLAWVTFATALNFSIWQLNK